MLSNYLPQSLSSALDKIPYKSLCELRLRADAPAIINVLGQNHYLCSEYASDEPNNAIVVSLGQIQAILNKIANNSLYTINDQLLEGYVSIPGGIRVGVCGETVQVGNKLKTLKNVSSLNFRFPHFLKNCSLKIYPYIVTHSGVKSTLIISPPGAGKTTFIRDLIYQLSNREKLLNILVIDERQEISSIYDGDKIMKLNNVDIYSNSSKEFGFNNGIRSMKPDVIITDEINIDRDISIIENALTCGVKVIATMHAGSIQDLKNKVSFKSLLQKNLFERFVLLSNSDGAGTVEGVFDEYLNLIGVWWNYFY